MDFFDFVNEQMEAVRLPLYAVTVTAAARVNTPLIAILHWHGFLRETPLALPGVALPRRPVPGSAIQFALPWHALESIDETLPHGGSARGNWSASSGAAATRSARRPAKRLRAARHSAITTAARLQAVIWSTAHRIVMS